MVRVQIHDLKARLSHFLRLVQNGETVIILKRNIPIGEITSPKPHGKRELGLAAKQYPDWKPDDTALLEPMSKEELALWYDAPLVSDASNEDSA